jgi:hypothetical protein
MFLAFNLNSPNQGSNGFYGIRHRENADGFKAGVLQADMNAFPDCPNLGFTRHGTKRFDGIIGYLIIEPSNESLVGPENNRADDVCIVGRISFFIYWHWAFFPKTNAQS